MKKSILLVALVAAATAAFTESSYAQQNWDYSYTFNDGLDVSGTFKGFQVGNTVTGYVDDITDITMSFNSVPVSGPISPYSFTTGSGWLNSGAVVGFDMSLSDFNFVSASGYQFFSMPSSIYAAPYASAANPAGVILGADYPANSGTWSLVDPPSCPVPDGGSAAMICGMSLVALGWLRRKLA